MQYLLQQGSCTDPLKVLEFKSHIFQAWKVMEIRMAGVTNLGKSALKSHIKCGQHISNNGS